MDQKFDQKVGRKTDPKNKCYWIAPDSSMIWDRNEKLMLLPSWHRHTQLYRLTPTVISYCTIPNMPFLIRTLQIPSGHFNVKHDSIVVLLQIGSSFMSDLIFECFVQGSVKRSWLGYRNFVEIFCILKRNRKPLSKPSCHFSTQFCRLTPPYSDIA